MKVWTVILTCGIVALGASVVTAVIVSMAVMPTASDVIASDHWRSAVSTQTAGADRCLDKPTGVWTVRTRVPDRGWAVTVVDRYSSHNSAFYLPDPAGVWAMCAPPRLGGR